MSKKPAPNEAPETPRTARQNLVAFLNNIGNVAADKVNPAFKSRYASLPELLDSVKAVAKDYDLSVHQCLSSSDGTVRVTTTILHDNGEEFLGGSVAFKSDGLDPQKLASAVTYLRRLCLKTAVGIETDLDDDGAAASRPTPAKSVQAPARSDLLSYLSAEDALSALVYCRRKSWITAAQTVSDLSSDKVEAINAQFPAFLAAIRKESVS
jgi:hypothetical protein